MKMKAKKLISLVIALVIVFSTFTSAFLTTTAVSSSNIFCNVKFSKPAICCDAGETIDLTQCGVQFSADSVMINNGIKWTYNGSNVTSFVPSSKGVYELTAKYGNNSKTIYVVAKNYDETEYVLYRNDFSSTPSDFRIVENTNGVNVSSDGNNLVMNASGNANSYIRVLLPEFLDDFGDAKIEASMKMASSVDSKKWSSLMYRVQNEDYPHYQGCMRFDATQSNGIELSQRNEDYAWEVYKEKSFSYANPNNYNLCSITAKGTYSVLHINGFKTLEYSNTKFANGGFGFQTRGTNLMIDFVEVSLDGNNPIYTSHDVSFAKPAIRADIGDTIDLSSCDVQFTVDSLYTDGSNITWKQDGKEISTFTPQQAGVTHLTATYSGVTKNIYVVTRNLTEGEHVLYRNDFDTAPTDFRVIQKDNASAYHDGAGNYVIDASSTANSFGRVLLPSFLDDFGDFKFEASYKETNQANETCWSSLMGRVQNQNFPYMQMCIRYNSALTNGIEIAQRNEQNQWSIKTTTSYEDKTAGNYNAYAISMQSNAVAGFANGEQIVYYRNNLYVNGAMGLQAKGLKISVDYVKVTLGLNTATDDTAVRCTIAKPRPAVGCNVGQKVLLNECKIQFDYGSPAIDGSQVIWKKDGNIITEFSDTTLGIHTLTATYGDKTMNVYIIAKKTTDFEYVVYENDFSTAPTNFRVPEASNDGSCYQQNGAFVLNGSSNANSYVRVLLPSYIDDFGDVKIEASIKLTKPTDSTKWGSIIYRAQNDNMLYMQGCVRYNAAVDNGAEISQKNTDGTWTVYQKTSVSSWKSESYNTVGIDTYRKTSTLSINGSNVLSFTNTPYDCGSWGMQVRGATMMIDHIKIIFTNNNNDLGIYTVNGKYADVRDVTSGISIAPSLITDVKTKSDFDNILSGSPAIAIMKYDVINGEARVVFNDGSVSPKVALDKLSSMIIPAFRIDDNTDADSLASFLMGQNFKDAYAVSTTPSVVKRAYQNWKYIRGVVDYSSRTSFDAESIRYEATENGARVLILPESTSKNTVQALQDSYSCVWLTISEGKTASVAATNKGPYGIITPDRAVTEHCYKAYYPQNTLVRRTNVIGHRGNPSTQLENTVVGTQTAYKNGATMVENDIYLVADGVLMVMHDATIDRTTNGSGSVTGFTSAQLKQYVVDYKSNLTPQPIPSLEDYFKSIKGKDRQKLVIEIKHPNTAFAQELVNLIKKYDILDQTVIISFLSPNLVATKKLLPGAPYGLLNEIKLDETDTVLSVQTALETIQNFNSVCNPKYGGWGTPMIQEFIYRGVTLWPWTINDQSQFDSLMIANIGGITTDYSQWSTSFVDNLTITGDGRVVATNYAKVSTDVTKSAEFVVVEDNLGISYSNGVLNVPQKAEGGKASYFFRYKSTTPTGIPYYTVTDLRTVEVAPQAKFELKDDSILTLADSQLTGVTDKYTVSKVKAEFKHPVIIKDKNGNVLSNDSKVTTGSTVYLESDSTKNAVIVIKGDINGDGIVNSTDYLMIKSHFLKTITLTGVYKSAADSDGSGIINTDDYLRIKSHFIRTFDLYA